MVVFDGYKDLSRQGSLPSEVDVVFSSKETADARIKRMVEVASQPKNLVVISDDREIAFFARQAGAHPMTVEEFLCRAPQARRLRGIAGKKTKGHIEEPDPKISYTAMQKINQEFSKIWLK